MTAAPASAAPLPAELVAPVANMLAAAVAGGGVRGAAGARALGGGASGSTRMEVGDERRDESGSPASGSDGVDLHSAVDDGAGTRPQRIDRAAVRAGRAGDGVGWPGSSPGHRRRPGRVRPVDRGPGRIQGLVARVCLGEVGAVFGLEVSRLARSTADLSRLLEFARLTDTLVIDSDGVYDLAEFNDRLLLGLKGTMSEAELHLLAGRLQGAKRAAAARGELRCPLPVGYVHDDRRADRDRPRRGGRHRDGGRVRGFFRGPARPSAWSVPSPAGRSRSAPTAGCGPVSCGWDD